MNVARQNICPRHRDRLASDLRRFVCEKGVVIQRIMHRRQSRLDDFKRYQGWKVSEQFQPRYKKKYFILVWSDHWKDTACQDESDILQPVSDYRPFFSASSAFDRIYGFHMRSTVNFIHNRYSRKQASLNEQRLNTALCFLFCLSISPQCGTI